MTDAAGDRPQDVGRRHSKQGSPSVASVELLERYRGAMRAELSDLLDEMRVAGQLDLFDVNRPTLERRAALWALAVKLARELESERAPAELGGTGGIASRSRPAPRLTVAARRSLGQ
jgi:hypothetical protein